MTSTSGATSAGFAIKGPLENALVFVDANNNGKLDEGETSARTGADGSYSLANPNGNTIVVITDEQTVDTSSGAVLAGITMKASASSGVITPFTALDTENTGLDTSVLATKLGLEGVDLLTFNPYDDGVGAVDALKGEGVSQQLTATLQIVASALNGANTDADYAATDAFTDALQSMAEAAIAFEGDTIDFSDNSADGFVAQFVNSLEGLGANAKATLITKITDLGGAIGAEIDTAVQAAVEAGDTADKDTLLNNNDALKSAFSAASVVAEKVEQAVTDAAGDDDAIATLINDSVGEVAEIVANKAPVILGLAAKGSELSVDENTASTNDGDLFVGSIEVSDEDTLMSEAIAGGDEPLAAVPFSALTYTLVGDNKELFVIEGTSVYLNSEAEVNFEELAVDGVATLKVGVKVTDSGGKSATKFFDVAIKNVNEDTTGEVTVDGDLGSGSTLTATIDAADEDNTIAGGDESDFKTVSYQWKLDGADVEGATEATFDLTEAMAGQTVSLVVTVVDQADNEHVFDEVSYGVVVSTAPTAISLGKTLSVDENIDGAVNADLLVGELLVEDTGTDGAFTFELLGANAALFEIKDGSVYLKADADVDYEALDTPELALDVKVTDVDGNDFTESFTVAITNVNEATTGDVTGAGDLGSSSTLSAIIGARDEDNTIAGGDASAFKTVSYQWKLNGADVEGATEATFDLTEAMAGQTVSLVVMVVDQADNEHVFDEVSYGVVVSTAPTAISLGETLSVDENIDGAANADLLVGELSVEDTGTEGDFTFELLGANAALFEIKDGSVYLKADADVDYEALDTPELALDVKVTDVDGNDFTESFTITVENADDPTTVDDYTLPVPAVGQSIIPYVNVFDDDNLNGGINTKHFVEVLIQWKVDGADVGSQIALDLTLDEPIDTVGAALDVISDYVGKVISVEATFTDQSGNESIQTFTYKETIPTNEAPTDITLTGDLAVFENIPDQNIVWNGDVTETLTHENTDRLVGALSVVDDNLGGAATFALVGDNADLFEIDTDGNVYLKVDADLDYEAGEYYELVDGVWQINDLFEFTTEVSITVEVTDAGGLTFEKSFDVTVKNDNDFPTWEFTFNPNPDIGYTVGSELEFDHFFDVDNITDLLGPEDFKAANIAWVVGTETVQSVDLNMDLEYPLETDGWELYVSSDMEGQPLTLQFTVTDQLDNDFVVEADYGTIEALAIPSASDVPLYIEVGAEMLTFDMSTEVDLLMADLDAFGMSLDTAMMNWEAALETLDTQLYDAGETLADTLVFAASGSDVTITIGDSTVSAALTFTDMSYATVEEFFTAIDGFDPTDDTTWNIAGTLTEIAFNGSSGTMFKLETGTDGLRIVLQDGIADTDHVIDQVGITGDFVGLDLSWLANTIAASTALDAEIDDLFANHAPAWSDYMAWDAFIADIDARYDAFDLQLLADQSPSGLYVQYADATSPEFQISSTFDPAGTDEIAIEFGDYRLQLRGDMPDDATDVAKFTGLNLAVDDTKAGVIDLIDEILMDQYISGAELDDLITGTDAAYGLNDIGVTGDLTLELLDVSGGGSDTLMKVQINDLAALADAAINSDPADPGSAYLGNGSEENGIGDGNSYIYEASGAILMVGNGIDVETLYDLLGNDELTVLGYEFAAA